MMAHGSSDSPSFLPVGPRVSYQTEKARTVDNQLDISNFVVIEPSAPLLNKAPAAPFDGARPDAT